MELVADLERVHHRKKAANKELEALLAETGSSRCRWAVGAGRPQGTAGYIERLFDMLAFVPCGWRVKGRTRCGDRDMAVRDLGPTYGKLRVQPVCRMHRDYIDAATRSQRKLPPVDVPDPDA